MSDATWERLEKEAQVVVERTIRELPPEIRELAAEVPCLFEPECAEDPELLGIYCEFTPGEMSPANGPIILYLRAIEDYCEDEGTEFAAEVRVTYLHELGHHFGWDEDDLDERGLG